MATETRVLQVFGDGDTIVRVQYDDATFAVERILVQHQGENNFTVIITRKGETEPLDRIDTGNGPDRVIDCDGLGLTWHPTDRLMRNFSLFCDFTPEAAAQGGGRGQSVSKA